MYIYIPQSTIVMHIYDTLIFIHASFSFMSLLILCIFAFIYCDKCVIDVSVVFYVCSDSQ